MCPSVRLRDTVMLLGAIFMMAAFHSRPAHAQEAVWTRLSLDVMTLHSRGQYGQAIGIAKQAIDVAEKTFGENHPNVALSLNNLAELYRALGQYTEAESLNKRSLTIWEKLHGPYHPDVAVSLNNLAALYILQGKYAQSELPLTRALAIRENALGPDHPDVAVSLNNLAELYRRQGRYAPAAPLDRRALAIREKALGPDHPDVGQSLNNLAASYTVQGQYAQAEPLMGRSLSIREKLLGPDHPDVAMSLINLADLHRSQGRYAQAEPLLSRALAIFEKNFGPDHPYVASSLNSLALLYVTEGRFPKAEPFFKRAIAIRESVLGPDHPEVASSLNNLAASYTAQGEYAQAAPLYTRSLAIMEKALGPHHPEVATNLHNLAASHTSQAHFSQAEPLFRRSLAIREKAFGPDNPEVATSLLYLAEMYRAQGQYAQAEPLFKLAIAKFETIFGPDHPSVAKCLVIFAAMYDAQREYAQALPLARRASAIYRQRIIAGGTGDAAVTEASQNRNGFHNHLALLFRNPLHEAAGKITDEALHIVQLEQSSGTASAIAKVAARFAGGDDALAALIKRKQDANDRRIRGEAQILNTSVKPPQEREAIDVQRLRDDVSRTGKEIEAVDSELTRRFPEYQELTRPKSLSVSQIRSLLRPDEAMLVYAIGETSFIWIAKQDGTIFQALKVDAKDIARKVARIRSEMEFDSDDRLKRVSVGLLHDLYQGLFAPALPHLVGAKHVMVVPSGPLQSLPFSMLVSSAPPEIMSHSDYRQVDWLAKHYALSVLPSVSSIQAFRLFNKTRRSQEPFAGFGDPLIGGTHGTTRGKISIATLFRTLPVSNVAQGAEIADVEAIRKAPRLPETAVELRAMAKALKSDQKSLWLQENATETKIKRLDLSKYRTLAFATHGVMAGEVKGSGEAGLILTPPMQGSEMDDGYLSAGEIARLRLDADWVVLSACNTAATDGTPGAEGFSGLAKAFFYAGARTLLVSHWPVASEATVPLTTGMLTEYAANPGQGKAEAHRKSMLALMNTPSHPEYAHPLFWSPFVVVGEGGAGTAIQASRATR